MSARDPASLVAYLKASPSQAYSLIKIATVLNELRNQHAYSDAQLLEFLEAVSRLSGRAGTAPENDRICGALDRFRLALKETLGA